MMSTDQENMSYNCVITLDFDIPYRSFRRSRECNKVMKFTEENRKQILGVKYRRSAGGNTHVKLIMKKPITVLHRFALRSYLDDDRVRVSLDLKRWMIKSGIYITRNVRGVGGTDRLWDFKSTKKGKVTVAGEWSNLTSSG